MFANADTKISAFNLFYRGNSKGEKKIMEEVKFTLSAPLEYVARKNQKEPSPKPYRSDFMRDRDRILYSVEFRRLSGKTQVFLATSDDQIRTRLTHTIEVSQIARVTSERLKLRNDLAEAIALGHDVGHTPFGHVGEQTLNFIMNGCDNLTEFQDLMEEEDKGFKHNLQGLRVTSELERIYGKIGLNLTNFTLWGIKNHTNTLYKSCPHHTDNCCFLKLNPKECSFKNYNSVKFYDRYESLTNINDSENEAWSLEAYVVRMADEIAQRHHDIQDALHMKIITAKELQEQIESVFRQFFDSDDKKLFEKLGKNLNKIDIFLTYASKFVVHFLNKNLINESIKRMNEFIKRKQFKRKDFVHNYPDLSVEDVHNIVGLPQELAKKEKDFQNFLKNRILNSFRVQRMDGKGRFIIRRLFKAYLTNPRQLHDPTIVFVFRLYEKWKDDLKKFDKKRLGEMRDKIDSPVLNQDYRFQISLLRAICDHVAGMTDRFAISEHLKLYGESI